MPGMASLKFSLRSLTLAVTVCAVALGVFGQRLFRWRQQQAATQELSQVGGRFTYQNGWVTFAYVIGVSVQDKHLARLSALPRLRVLLLEMSNVTDSGMANLQALPQLEHLDMSAVRIGDDGIKHLETLSDLTHLDLIATRVTDEGLRHLRPLNKLKVLKLNSTAVTDAGMEHLASLTNLQELWLQRTAVTADSIAKLQERIPNCKIITQ
jgi:hypothetical protein